MNAADYITIGIVALAVVGAVLLMRRRKKRGSCCGTCDGCRGCGKAERKED